MELKAYHVYDKDRDLKQDQVVFAESPGRAKTRSRLAQELPFTEICARRIPELDQYAYRHIPMQALLDVGFEYECRECRRHVSKDNAVIVEERIYCDNCGGPSKTAETVYDDAVAMVIQKQRASVSMMQHGFGLTYRQAAKVIDRMEREGLIGPFRGTEKDPHKPREVLFKNVDEWKGAGLSV